MRVHGATAGAVRMVRNGRGRHGTTAAVREFCVDCRSRTTRRAGQAVDVVAFYLGRLESIEPPSPIRGFPLILAYRRRVDNARTASKVDIFIIYNNYKLCNYCRISSDPSCPCGIDWKNYQSRNEHQRAAYVRRSHTFYIRLNGKCSKVLKKIVIIM